MRLATTCSCGTDGAQRRQMPTQEYRSCPADFASRGAGSCYVGAVIAGHRRFAVFMTLRCRLMRRDARRWHAVIAGGGARRATLAWVRSAPLHRAMARIAHAVRHASASRHAFWKLARSGDLHSARAGGRRRNARPLELRNRLLGRNNHDLDLVIRASRGWPRPWRAPGYCPG